MSFQNYALKLKIYLIYALNPYIWYTWPLQKYSSPNLAKHNKNNYRK